MEVFKVGDRVFHFHYKWGVITDFSEEQVEIKWGPCILIMTVNEFNQDYKPYLSFTQYTFQNFSQERPQPQIEKDTLIYVSDGDQVWHMRYFSHFSESGMVFCFDMQKKSTETNICAQWEEWSLENPLLK